jgi:predicted CXXCH cytochrome family protein
MTSPARSARVSAMIVALCAALFCSLGAARAGDGRVPMPTIPKAQGERCVADTDFMRRNHMTVLSQQHEDAVHLGQRKAEFQLQRCLTCHAVAGTDGKPVSYANARHFCRSCHDYAAVAVDCFQCHSSVPAPKAQASRAPTDANALTLLGNQRDQVR